MIELWKKQFKLHMGGMPLLTENEKQHAEKLKNTLYNSGIAPGELDNILIKAINYAFETDDYFRKNPTLQKLYENFNRYVRPTNKKKFLNAKERHNIITDFFEKNKNLAESITDGVLRANYGYWGSKYGKNLYYWNDFETFHIEHNYDLYQCLMCESYRRHFMKNLKNWDEILPEYEYFQKQINGFIKPTTIKDVVKEINNELVW